ncbi:hypothetical protein E2C01_091790 [Portunus trituberculatus]|uniref:Uncharacterized protein n=1 Tax=Portunus trituberculatus TaxID=210409 RepID=A0A5B7JTT0_PORTR|nr:hypothetical protein [Portunus trituberculatus]
MSADPALLNSATGLHTRLSTRQDALPPASPHNEGVLRHMIKDAASVGLLCCSLHELLKPLQCWLHANATVGD